MTRQLLILTMLLGLTVLYGQTTISDRKDNFARQSADNSYKSATLKKMQGTWIVDSLSVIIVSDTVWNFRCEHCAVKPMNSEVAEDSQRNNYYSIKITDKLPQYTDTIAKTEFLVLTPFQNKKNTFFYEILGLTDTTMSLMHYPSAKRQLYKKKK